MTAYALHGDPLLGDEPAHEALTHTEVVGGLLHREQSVHHQYLCR
jgi:hypothetical protein